MSLRLPLVRRCCARCARAAALLAAMLPQAFAANSASPRIDPPFFATAAADGSPAAQARSTFDCAEPVYAVLRTRGLGIGEHRFEAIWTDPRGRRREHTDFRFSVHAEERVVWAWLRLHRPPQRALERVLLMDSAAGMEDLLGRWSVRFLVDGRTAGQGSFRVMSC